MVCLGLFVYMVDSEFFEDIEFIFIYFCSFIFRIVLVVFGLRVNVLLNRGGY